MSAGSHARRRGRRRLLVVVLVVLVALVAAAMALWRPDALPGALTSRLSDPTEAACVEATVRVAVAPRVEALAREALDRQADGLCARFAVEALSERAVNDAVFFGEPVPDIWIPDGEWSLGKLPVDVVAPALASTPVVLVGGAGARRPASWSRALTGGSVAVPDPLTDSVGTLAMLAPRQEAVARRTDLEAARSFLVPMAQAYGEVAADGREMDVSLRSLTATSPRLVATTEQDVLASGKGDAAWRVVVPRTGATLLRFPLAVSDDAAPVAREAARGLTDWFESDEGVDALRDAGLRGPDGRAQGRATGLGQVRYLPAPGGTDVDDYRFTWQVMSVPSSVLAVLDVSGSMDFPAAAGRRIDVATGAASVALDLFPGHARIGLWVFSIDRGGPGQDWRVLEPVRRLDATAGGVTQRDRLRSRVDEVGALTTGGTGLYDTALAAYRQALRLYDPAYANSVILMTDGANDDPGSISGRAVLRRLRGLVDPQRPVRIIGIAISDDADLPALRRIAEATGGRAHRADRPDDILRVFTQEIANR